MELTLESIKDAQNRIQGVIRQTPLLYSSTFSTLSGCQVYLKCENKQKTGSFKLRGAYNKIASLDEAQKSRGVIASSAGNHAQGVAYAASMMGTKATIVMPVTAPQAKVNATIGYGATVVQCGEVYDECYEKALELYKASGSTFIHPFNDIDVMAGQGTLALEILNEISEMDAIIVPVGGGGLIAGIVVAAKSLKPSIKIIGVQPAIIASSKASLKQGNIVTLPGVRSLADGISVSTPGDITFEYIKKYVDDIVTVSEDEIAYSIFSLMEWSKLIAEGAGACSLAALINNKISLKNKKVTALISGGNIDIAMVSKIINRQLVLSGRRIRFSVKLQDRVGQLGALINSIVLLGGNIVTTTQERNWDERGLDYAMVTFEIEAQTKEHSDKILGTLKGNGYEIIGY